MKYSAGILPYAVDNGKIYYLLGRDWRDYGWSDFGGKYESGDLCVKYTACREFYEETMGCVYTFDTLYDILQNPANCTEIKSMTLSGYPYYMYLIQIPYLNYKTIFFKILSFTKYINRGMSRHSMFFEKNSVQWFDSSFMKRMACANLNNHIKTQMRLRGIFKQTVKHHMNEIIKHEDSIISTR